MANASQHGPRPHATEQEKHEQGSSQRPQPEPSTTGTIVNAVTEKAKDLASGASELASGAKETVQEWGSAAADAASHAKQKAQECATSAAHKADHLGEDVTALIRRYPTQAFLVGLGVGFVLGQMRRP
jgi:X-X-X-Leu-X-X-Gly heptad repeat protein